MVYIYDVLTNPNNILYDFYDWNIKDNLTNIRKTPLFKVDNKTYIDICSKTIKIDKLFLKQIKNKTEVFNNINLILYPYSCIISNSINSIFLVFNSSGNIILKSKFLINEETEINTISKKLKLTNIDYTILNNKINTLTMLRDESNTLDLLISSLLSIKDNKELINYLYYEYSNINKEINYKTFIKELKKEYTPKHKELLNLINMYNIKNKVKHISRGVK